MEETSEFNTQVGSAESQLEILLDSRVQVGNTVCESSCKTALMASKITDTQQNPTTRWEPGMKGGVKDEKATVSV